MNPVDWKVREGRLSGGIPGHFVKPSTVDLGVLAGLVDAGWLTVHVQRTFPLAQAAARSGVRPRPERVSGCGGGPAARCRRAPR